MKTQITKQKIVSYIQNHQNIFSIAIILLLVVSLIPLMILGKYGHALGDDYHYGVFAKNALDQSGFAEAIVEAGRGVIRQYNIWQGTYSAMFLMHLPPHIFGDFFYKLYPSVLLSLFTLGIFYFMKPIITTLLKSTNQIWIILSAVISFLCVQQVPLMGEAFFWYNGSMYYTGFFTLTLYFLGGIIRFLNNPKTAYVFLLSICAFFLAGGNYTSLLPTILILILIIVYSFLKRKDTKVRISLIIILLFMLLGFSISALAPGNVLRQETAYKTTPLKAIIKSLIQGFKFLGAWSNVWLFATIILLTPLFICIIKKLDYSFRYPFWVCSLSFGIYSSASCPTYYAQNNCGAARAFDLSWYTMVFLVLGCYFYLLGWYIKKINVKVPFVSLGFIVFVFCGLLFVRPIQDTYVQLNAIHATKSILSGDAYFYEKQYQERKSLLNSEQEDIVFSPYEVPESLVYVLHLGDLSPDPSNFYNEAFANFYYKNSVYVSQ